MPHLSPEWLTGVLYRAGVLQQGHVAAVQTRRNAAFNSCLLHCTLTYSGDALSTVPRDLIYKANLSQEWAKDAGRAEVEFYRQVALLPDHPPLTVPCYVAEYDPSTGDSFLLLLDLCKTHHNLLTRDQQLTPGSNVPSETDADAAVGTLARFHAYWWEHLLLDTEIFPITRWFRDEEWFRRYTARRTAAFEELMAAEAAWFPAEVAQAYETVLARMPQLWERYYQPRVTTLHQMTLTHGDSYFANFLSPNEGIKANVYLIDWQSPETLWAASDLANMIATFWTSEQRQENGREERLLRRYYEGLQAAGVSGYGWEDLLRDYRLAIIDWLLVPLQDRRDGSSRDYWWPKMQCLFEAYRDRLCRELLD